MLTVVLYSLGVLVPLLLLRILYLISFIILDKNILQAGKKSLRTIYCVGSGGHTSELLRIIQPLSAEKYSPRLYILADNDTSSDVKVHRLEQTVESKYSLARIPRSRNVNQSYKTAVLTTIYSTLYTIPIIYNFKPDLVICNGPGTCIPVCLIVFLMRVLRIVDSRIVFIESVCRVRSMSLTGKILYFFADQIIVQWPHLLKVCSRAKFFGRLA